MQSRKHRSTLTKTSKKDGGSRATTANRRQGNSSHAVAPGVAAHRFWVAVALGVFTLANFAVVYRFDFVRLDDPDYVTNNPTVAAGLTWKGIIWAMTSGHAANWHPLTWLSHMADVQFFGMNPGWHHLVNVGFHALNTVLLFLVLSNATGASVRSALVAAFFAVHPLHVESVAWISERKDVLSTCLWMLTLFAYLSFVRRRTARQYAIVVFGFVLALMAKPMVVTLPFVLLLIDVWPLRRIVLWRDGSRFIDPADRPTVIALAVEKIPLVILAVASGVVTVVAQRAGGALGNLHTYPLSLRIENAIINYAVYMWRMIWPMRLAALYPYRESLRPWEVMAAAALLAALSLAAVRLGRRRPYLLVGWLWYVVTLAPVIGFVQVGLPSTADRYTYIPLIGLFIIASWGGADLLERWAVPRVAASGAAAAALVACSVRTQAQLATWRDSLALWQHAVDVTSRNAPAQYNLGVVLVKAGHLDEGVERFRDALRIDSNYVDVHIDLGNALAQRGQTDDAIREFATVVRLRPDYADARVAYAILLREHGRNADAMDQLRVALRSNPKDASAHNEFGTALSNSGQLGQAISEYESAVRLAPDFSEAHNNLGAALARSGDYQRATVEFSEALRLKPDNPMFHYNAALMLEHLGRRDEAVDHLRRALRADPGNRTMQQALARLTAQPNGGRTRAP